MSDVDQAIRSLARSECPTMHESVRHGLTAMRAAVWRHRMTREPREQALASTNAIMRRLYDRVAAASTYAAIETIPAPPGVPNVAPPPNIPALPTRATYTWSTIRSEP